MQCLNGDWNYIAKCLPDSMALVVGGQRVKRGQLPWHAGIYRKTVTPYLQICGGSLISTNVVISAAHCFWNDLEKQLPASQFAVAVGKLYRPWDDPMDQSQKSDVKVIHVPARYQGAGAHDQDDIAVVVSAHEFQFNTYIRPVCLNFDYRFEIQQLGDSGGGLAYSSSPMGVERYYLRGVVSTAPTSDSACNTAVYTSFTSITKHEQFIKQFWIESGEFRCQEGSFITATNYCDGARDCADGSDETEDACSTKICSDYLFRCAYGACVDRGATCNGVLLISRTETFYRSSEVSCTLPPYPEHGAYTTDVAGAEPGQGYERVTLSNVTCERGYAARGSISQEFSCSNGVWTESIPRCVSQTLAQAYTHAHWDAGNPTHEDNHPYVYMRRDGAFFNWHDDYQFAFVCEKEHNAT
ncbi:Hemolymph protein 14, partial [Operophtera brumata]